MSSHKQIKVTFADRRAVDQTNPSVFIENIDGNDLSSLRQTIQRIQTKMNNWLTEEIEKGREANLVNSGKSANQQHDDDESDDDEEEEEDDDGEEPPFKQQKT